MTSTSENIRPGRRRLPVAIAAALVAGSVYALLFVVVMRHGSDRTARSTGPASAAAFPAPPRGAVVFSRELGQNALALAVSRRNRRLVTQASVVGPDGAGVTGLAVSFAVDGVSALATPCGSGCYAAELATRTTPRKVLTVIDGDSATRWNVPLPATWPPRDASKTVARADRVWRALRSLAFTDRLASSEDYAVTSSWQAQAPDRLAYQIDGGAEAVIVGKRRWDRDPGGAWRRSPQVPVHQPSPPWARIRNAFVLGAETVRGRPAWKVSFFDPESRAWFTVLLDRSTLRTLELDMITTAHFMHEVYGGFDSTPTIRPPR
jgi:hypothetical protein